MVKRILRIIKKIFKRQRSFGFGNMAEESKKLRESTEFKNEIKTIQDALQKREEKTIDYNYENIIRRSNEISKRRKEIVGKLDFSSNEEL